MKKLLLLVLLTSLSFMLFSQIIPQSAGTFISTGAGTAWTNPSNANSDAGTYTNATLLAKGNLTESLRLTNFNFSGIPDGATINGISLEILKQGANGNTVDESIRLMKAASTPIGDNRKKSEATWPKSVASRTYGSSTDLWGSSWALADIKGNTNFGVEIIAKARKANAQPQIYTVKITVYYNQSIYYSKSTGALNIPATWVTNADGSGTTTNPSLSGANCIFIIANRTTYTLTADLTIDGTNSKLVVGNGTNAIDFTIPSGFSYTGIVDVANNSILRINNTALPILGALGTLTTVGFGATGSQSIPAKSYYKLLLSGTGTKTLAGASSVTEEFNIGSGITFSDGDKNCNVTKTLIKASVHTSSGSNGGIIMGGASAQTISGSNNGFGNLSIFNSANVTMTSSITVNGILRFAEGALSIGANKLTINGTTVIETGTLTGSANSNITIGGTGDMGSLPSSLAALNNLTVNRTLNGKITIINPLTVGTILTMTAGNIYNGTHVITLGTSTSSRGTLTHTSGCIQAILKNTLQMLPIVEHLDYFQLERQLIIDQFK